MGRRAATLAGASCQEPKKGPKGELHSKKPQPQPEPQESGPSWARPQLPAAQPPASQPRRPPQRSGGQDAPRRGSLQHSLQPGPSPRTDCRPQAWPPILPGSGQWGAPLPASPVPRMPVHTALPQPPRDPATPASGCVCVTRGWHKAFCRGVGCRLGLLRPDPPRHRCPLCGNLSPALVSVSRPPEPMPAWPCQKHAVLSTLGETRDAPGGSAGPWRVCERAGDGNRRTLPRRHVPVPQGLAKLGSQVWGTMPGRVVLCLLQSWGLNPGSRP